MYGLNDIAEYDAQQFPHQESRHHFGWNPVSSAVGRWELQESCTLKQASSSLGVRHLHFPAARFALWR